jgi:hypothetical protein
MHANRELTLPISGCVQTWAHLCRICGGAMGLTQPDENEHRTLIAHCPCCEELWMLVRVNEHEMLSLRLPSRDDSIAALSA